MNYPLISEYIEAIKSAEDNFEELKNLRPVLDEDGAPVMSGGNFAVVFKMKNEQTGKLYAVKCFLKEQEHRAESYRLIGEELEYVSSTFLTPIRYLDKELFVDSNASEDTEFPVLLMDWVEGVTLDNYIRDHIGNQYELSMLAYQFSRLAMWLMPQPFAHGDLKPDNILVREDGTLVLVDYDGMYVPAMKGQKARELGSPDFRHPSRTEDDFDEHIDDFSLASILLSLKAIALQPSLLEEYGAADRLLFSEYNYSNLSGFSLLDILKRFLCDCSFANLYSAFILALSEKNLTKMSFRVFELPRPTRESISQFNFESVDNQDVAIKAFKKYERQAKNGISDSQYIVGLCYENQWGTQKDDSLAAEWYRKAAEQGHSEGQLQMGYCLEEGQGVEKNYEEALKWFRKSAEKGNPVAIRDLGRCYCNGIGVSKDKEKAFKYHCTAAQKGNLKGMSCVACCYKNGYGVNQDYHEAFIMYMKLAEMNYSDGQWELGHCYEYGKGVEIDYAEAVKWYRKAAEQGDSDGQWRLGVCYGFGQGVEKDYAEAVRWYRKAAEQGDSDGQLWLGLCYNSGLGVEKDYAEAVKWYRKSAEQGDSDGQWRLGFCYYYGQGVEKDYAEAVKWYRKAAEQGDSVGQWRLGICYKFGQGVEKDYAEAVKWYRKAAEQGNSDGQWRLGVCYEKGIGTNINLHKAKEYYQLAANQNHSKAVKSLSRVNHLLAVSNPDDLPF